MKEGFGLVYLDVPAKWTELLPLLDDGVKEAQPKHQSPPCHSKYCMYTESVAEMQGISVLLTMVFNE